MNKPILRSYSPCAVPFAVPFKTRALVVVSHQNVGWAIVDLATGFIGLLD